MKTDTSTNIHVSAYECTYKGATIHTYLTLKTNTIPFDLIFSLICLRPSLENYTFKYTTFKITSKRYPLSIQYLSQFDLGLPIEDVQIENRHTHIYTKCTCTHTPTYMNI